jgi:hypothetical protein
MEVMFAMPLCTQVVKLSHFAIMLAFSFLSHVRHKYVALKKSKIKRNIDTRISHVTSFLSKQKFKT